MIFSSIFEVNNTRESSRTCFSSKLNAFSSKIWFKFSLFKIVSSQRSVDWDIYVTVTWELRVADFANNQKIIKCNSGTASGPSQISCNVDITFLHHIISICTSASNYFHLCLMPEHWESASICNALYIFASKNIRPE